MTWVPIELIDKHQLSTFIQVKTPVWNTETTQIFQQSIYLSIYLSHSTENLIWRICSVILGLKSTERQEGRYSWDSGMQEDLGTSRGGAWGAVEPLRGVRGCAWGVTKLEEEPAEVTRAIVRATLGGSASWPALCFVSSPPLVDRHRKPASGSHNRTRVEGWMWSRETAV